MLDRVIWRLSDLLFRFDRFIPLRSRLLGLIARTSLRENPLGRLARKADTALKRLVASSAPNPLVVDGHTLFHDPSEWDFVPVLAQDRYEPEVTRVLRDLLQPGMTFVDLGAHIGYHTLLAARSVGTQGRVHAFEPSPYSYALLTKNVQANGYDDVVTCVPKAASSSRGTVQLFNSGREASLHFRAAVGEAPVLVEALTLDGYFRHAGWPPVDVIKMDIEGAEKAALEGMVELSARNPSLKLITEFNINCIRASQGSPAALFDVLQGLGFSNFAVVEQGCRALQIPEDIPALVSEANHSIPNILCEKEDA